MRFGTVLKLAGIGVLLLIVALVQVVKSIDVSSYRDILAQAAMAATGRDLAIRGKLSLKMSLSPALVANDVTFANAPWGSRPEMITLGRIEAKISLLPLLTREVRINRLVLVDAGILLERGANGQANWDFQPKQPARDMPVGAGGARTTFKLSQIELDNVQILYSDARVGRKQAVRIDRLIAQADNAAAPIGLNGSGNWNGRRFDLSGVFGTVHDLLASAKPFPAKLKVVLPGLVATANGTVGLDKTAPDLAFNLKAEATEIAEAARLVGITLPPLGAGRVALTLSGTAASPALTNIDLTLGRRDAVAINAKGDIGNPLRLSGMDLLLTAEGDNLAGFNKPLDLSLPALAPIKVTAHLTDAGGGWRLGDFKAILGHTDITGEATARMVGRRLVVDGRLASGNIDLGELAPTRDEVASGGKRADGRVFSDTGLPFELLSAFDGRLTWRIDRLIDGALTATGINVVAALQDGKLSLTPTVAAIAGGKISADLTVDASANMPSLALAVTADKVVAGDLLSGLALSQAVHGAPTDMRVNLTGTGNSLRAIMARLNGETTLAIGKGTVDGAYADVLAVDVLRQLAPWTDEKDTDMQCLVSRFSVADGMARSEALLFDTSRMTVGGQGSVNLANETIDLTLAPKPKEASLLSLAVPLDIGGTLARPTIAPNNGAIVKGVAGAVGAVALGPLAALVPLVSSGTGEANPCLAALAQAKKNSPARKPAKPAGGIGGTLQGLFGN